MKTRLLIYTCLGLFALVFIPAARGQTPASPPSQPSAPPPPTLTAPQGKVSPPPGQVDIAAEPTVKVVANVLPAVVNINAQKTVPQYITKYDQYFRLYRGVVNRTAQSIGSGLIVSADGYIITNAHVVALADQEGVVNITLSTGSKYQARIITADDDADLALLKIDDQSVQFPYFDLSYTSPNLLGETVIALGSPENYQNSVSRGILSAKGRTFTVEDHTYNNLIQTDAAINPGNSGGPLVDLNGGLVGINSAKLAGEAIENIGFAIPYDVVVAWAKDAMAEARGLKPPSVSSVATPLQVMRQRLGLSLKTLTADKADEMNLDIPGGLLITRVEDGSPAADAELREGMIVTGIGTRRVTDEKSLPRELEQLKAGGRVLVHVIYVQSMGIINIQRGGSVLLTAR
jgi:S1-C subfamily serine protease